MNKVYFIDDGEFHWYIAESEKEAIELHTDFWYKQTGETPPFREMYVSQVDDDRLLTVKDYGPNYEVIEQTAKEFAQENDKGFLATTAY